MNKEYHKEYINDDKIIIHNTFAIIFRNEGGKIRIPLPEDLSLEKKIQVAKQFLASGCKGTEIVTE